MNRRYRNISIIQVLVALLCTESALAAGYEKSLLWSAKTAALGGAVVGSTAGAEALYFNPAGLQQSKAHEVSLNFSPTFSKFSGANPYQNSGTTNNPGMVEGKRGFSPVGALLASSKLNEKWGVGAGYYVSGGTKAKFENLDYAHVSAGVPYTLAPTVETDLAITEGSLGAAYEVMPGLRFGAAWRVVQVKAEFSTVSPPSPFTANQAIGNSHVRDISATRWNAYRLGMQYDAPDSQWGAGLAYRSAVDFTAEGKLTATVNTAAGTTAEVAEQVAHVSNSFPQQLNIGGYLKATETLRTSLEYSFSDYGRNRELTVTTPSAATSTVIQQNWKNQHIGRVGFEYTGMGLPIRLGYAYTSQVTPSDRARSTFGSPGAGHAIALGSGLTFGALNFDYAFEYAFASGTGTNGPEVATDQTFKAQAYAAHLSGKLEF
jgi:hypothetical protein